MEKRNRIVVLFLVAVILTAVVMLSGMLRRTSHIVLPDTQTVTDSSDSDPEKEGDALTVVEVTPETVQTAIATLDRPAQYRRTVSIQQFWEDGSGTYDVTVAVQAPWTRIDRLMPDRQVRHTIIGPEQVYIWYYPEETVFQAVAGNISADQEQAIPTYEEILEIPTEEIALADYRAIASVDCIYVETAPDEEGYMLRYWVSLDSGLLVAAEKLQNEAAIYRMTALTLDQEVPTAEDFTLPDGTVLLDT